MWGYKAPLADWNAGSDKKQVYSRYLWMSRWVMGPDVLDIGCSHGSITRFIEDKNIELYIGVDLNPKAVAYAKKHSSYPWTHFTRELPGGVYDTVILAEVLEHQEDPENLLRTALERLKDDGRLIITTPHGANEVSDHRQVFYSDNFVALLDRVGLFPHQLEFRSGKIFCVSKTEFKAVEIDHEAAERSLSDNLERFICTYRVMERHYEAIPTVRVMKWLKRLFRR